LHFVGEDYRIYSTRPTLSTVDCLYFISCSKNYLQTRWETLLLV